MPKGTITLLVHHRLVDDSYGFIKGEGDIFFYHNDLQGVEYGSLIKGREWNLRSDRGGMVVRRQSG